MLYTPMLPEAASGTLEPRHVVVPLRQMCPHAELLLARVTAIDEERRVADDRAAGRRHGRAPLGAARRRARRRRAVAARARARRARGRLQGPRGRDPPPQPRAARAGGGGRRARSRPRRGASHLRLRRSRLRGRRGARGALRPRQGRPPLVSAAARPRRSDGCWSTRRRRSCRRSRPASASTPPASSRAAASRSGRRRRWSRLTAGEATLSDGERIPTHTLVWTAGVRAHPLLSVFGLPLDDRGRVRVDQLPPRRGPRAGVGARRLRRRPERRDARARRSADLPARAPPGPPAGQEPERHAAAVRLPDARPGGDARPLQGDRRRDGPAPARLSRAGSSRAATTSCSCRCSRASCACVADWTTSLFFRRDIAELSMLGHPRRLGE